MLELTIPPKEDAWDSHLKEFVKSDFKGATIRLEHSLIAISKWESKYHKPYLENTEMTAEELAYYVRCMTVTQSVPNEVYENLTQDNYNEIVEYIKDPMTATWFSKGPVVEGGAKKKQVVTSELIYYWMIAQNIPVEFEKWHLNRLMTLIEVCSIKNAEANGQSTKKKVSQRDLAVNNTKLNEMRRKAMHTKG